MPIFWLDIWTKALLRETQSPPNRTLSSASSASIFVVTVAVFPIGADFPSSDSIPFFLLREAREPSNKPAIVLLIICLMKHLAAWGLLYGGDKLVSSVS